MNQTQAFVRLFTVACLLVGFAPLNLFGADPPLVQTPAEANQLITRVYRVIPGTFENEVVRQVSEGKIAAGASPVIRQEDVKKFFMDAGVPFPAGASITYNRAANTLIVTSTAANLDTLERILEVINRTPPQVIIEARFISLPRDVANGLLKESQSARAFAGLDAKFLKSLDEMVDERKATILAQPRLITTSGSQADVKSAVEVEYPTEFSATENGIVPSGFTTREVGTLLNVQPTCAEDQYTINLVVVPERCTVNPVGKKVQVVPKGSDKPVTLELPQFSAQRITTTLTMWTGSTHLIGVFDPLPSERREGEDNLVLILLTATIQTTQHLQLQEAEK